MNRVHRKSRFASLPRCLGMLLIGSLLAGCSLQGSRGSAPAATSGVSTQPPGGMQAGAVGPLPAIASPTSAPIVPVATIVQAATPVQAAATPDPPTLTPLLTAAVATPVPPVPTETLPPVRLKPTAVVTVRREATVRAAASATALATVAHSASPSATPQMVNYVVQKGDDVYAIARRFKVTPAAIIGANLLTNPSALKIGQVLHIPQTGTSKVPTA